MRSRKQYADMCFTETNTRYSYNHQIRSSAVALLHPIRLPLARTTAVEYLSMRRDVPWLHGRKVAQ